MNKTMIAAHVLLVGTWLGMLGFYWEVPLYVLLVLATMLAVGGLVVWLIMLPVNK